MTHPNPPRSPYGQQPRHGHGAQPGYGYPAPQQPHPGPYAGGPSPYQTPPPPKKRMSTWAVAGIAFGGVFAFLILVGAIAGSGDDTTQADGKAAPKSSAPAEPAQEKKDDTPAESEPAPQSPVKIAAKKTAFAPSILHDGGAYTSVQVTITNNSDKKISVNPLYFSLTDTGGSKHTAELGVDENQMDTTDLAPGENMTGVITGKGGFTPKYVTYTDGLLGDTVRGDVS